MKRFTILSALILTVGVFTLAFGRNAEGKAVKYEVSVTIDTPSVEFSANDEAINVVFLKNYIMEPTGEVVKDFHPPTMIGKINSDYVTSLFKPPIINSTDLLPDVRRLSCASVVAASNRHI